MLKYFPWKYVVSRVARAQGLVDPVKLMSRLEGLAQPMELKEPLELLRAGMVFHARGILNAGVIQHNLDWVWPFWVERQYDPEDIAFIPRAFSLTHINLTHRNWTAVGLPECDHLPLVDPRGLVTPFWDGWSLDAWVISDDGRCLLPSRAERVEQELDFESGLAVVTRASEDDLRVASRVRVETRDRAPSLHLHVAARCETGGWLALAVRPYNPEGVSFVHKIQAMNEGRDLELDEGRRVHFAAPPEKMLLSHYRLGDVLRRLRDGKAGEWNHEDSITCPVGMATAAALFRLEPGSDTQAEAIAPLEGEHKAAHSLGGVLHSHRGKPSLTTWDSALDGCARLEVPDPKIQFLYDAALRTLVLHSPGEVYPGPFTYKRFWFRDAAFILYGLLAAGLTQRVSRVLDLFPGRQTRKGHFFSQEAEWDSNGEALWIMERFCALTGSEPSPAWQKAVRKGAKWITDKRLPDQPPSPHAGLLPAGFSAEHLGPNDYYYWDDFWSIAGLDAAAHLLDSYGDHRAAQRSRDQADVLRQAVDRSLQGAARSLERPAMPASPYRRLDSGAIGSLAVGYPLQLWSGDDPRLTDTASFLLDSCFVHGGFFQDMIHSGINPYLTLHVAQVLMRADDPRALDLIDTVANLASPTGQWPEAVHPQTGGGCMGDGQHAWAAAEWVLVLRNAFVREEGQGLVLGSGLAPAWWRTGRVASFGPTPTAFGPVTVRVEGTEEGVQVTWQGRWRGDPPPISIRLPFLPEMTVPASESRALVAAPGVLP